MKPLYPDLFPETLLVSRDGDRIFTTSLKVAEHFKKKHFHVLRAIGSLLNDLFSQSNFGFTEDFHQPNFGPAGDFSEPNFRLTEYPDRRGKLHKMYELSHDGFALLAMGFTGKEALAWKVQFLAAFRDMERQIVAQQKRESNALFQLRPKWAPIVAHPELRRQQLIGLTGHRSPGSITACRRRMRQVGLI